MRPYQLHQRLSSAASSKLPSLRKEVSHVPGQSWRPHHLFHSQSPQNISPVTLTSVVIHYPQLILDSTLSTTPNPLGSQLNPHVGSRSPFDHTVSNRPWHPWDKIDQFRSSGPMAHLTHPPHCIWADDGMWWSFLCLIHLAKLFTIYDPILCLILLCPQTIWNKTMAFYDKCHFHFQFLVKI